MAIGYAEESERQWEFDAAVTQLRPCIQSLQKANGMAILLAGAFTTRDQQEQVYGQVQSLKASDGHVTLWESTLLSELRLKFRL